MAKMENVRRRAGLHLYTRFTSWEDLLLEGRITVNGTVITGSKSNLVGELVIPEGITKIDIAAFRGRTGLSKVVLPSSLIDIEDFAFYGCSGLREVVFGDKLVEISYAAFSRCTELESIELPKHLGTIGKDAFYGCSNLRKVKMPDTLSNIYKTSFYGCSIDSVIWRKVDYNYFDIFLTVFTNEDVTRPSKTTFFGEN